MLTLFSRKLYKNGLMILGWGLGLALLGYFLFDIYESMFGMNIDLQQMLAAFPEEMLAFFGGDVDIFDPAGFIHLEFFSYIQVILGIVAVSGATSLIVKKEEEGSLELILAQPVSRSTVFWSQLAALILTLVLILVITWGGFALGLASTDSFDLDQGQLVHPFISLFAVLLLFLSLALLLSMILPTSGAASMVSNLVIIASFFITSLAQIDDRLEGLNRFSPMRYYQGGRALSGLNIGHLLILLGVSLAFLLLAWLLFEKRDLRFSGTGWLRVAIRRKGDSF
ncbi:MAG: ABC transporter permease subunit [Brevefilum sp.]|nr:ABC transporter permease subunit [Brevefilum sp.]